MLKPNSRPRDARRTKRAQSLRNEASASERVLWELLRKDRLGCSFRRQYPVGRYTLDFYCPALKLCIEVDGEQHFGSIGSDAERDSELATLGIRVIRIPSFDLFSESGLALGAWLRVIEEEVAALSASQNLSP